MTDPSLIIPVAVSLRLRWMLDSGGFAANVGLDPQLLSTLSGVQILAIYNELDRLDVDKTVSCTYGPMPPALLCAR